MDVLIWSVIIICELVFVEQFLIFIILKRKLNLWVSIGIVGALTAAICLLMVFVFSKQTGFGDGGGKNLVVGALYIIPGLLLFDGTIRRKLIVNFTAFTYGLGVYVISIRIGYLFNADLLYLVVFSSQTIINLILLPFITKFCKTRLISMLDSLSVKSRNTLIRFCIIAFLLIVMINSAITRGTSDVQKLFVVIFLFYLIILAYSILADYHAEMKKGNMLLDIAITSRVSGISNGILLDSDLNRAISTDRRFILAFLDLDSFKTINDNYGHIKGDLYLKEFAHALKGLEEEGLKVYHLSGDEFCIVSFKSVEQTLKMIDSIKIDSVEEMQFLGFSFGIAIYPDNAKTAKDILERADKNMYVDKTLKNKNKN